MRCWRWAGGRSPQGGAQLARSRDRPVYAPGLVPGGPCGKRGSRDGDRASVFLTEVSARDWHAPLGGLHLSREGSTYRPSRRSAAPRSAAQCGTGARAGPRQDARDAESAGARSRRGRRREMRREEASYKGETRRTRRSASSERKTGGGGREPPREGEKEAEKREGEMERGTRREKELEAEDR